MVEVLLKHVRLKLVYLLFYVKDSNHTLLRLFEAELLLFFWSLTSFWFVFVNKHACFAKKKFIVSKLELTKEKKQSSRGIFKTPGAKDDKSAG